MSSSGIPGQTVDEDLSSADSDDESVIKYHSFCGKLNCYEGRGLSVNLGKTRYTCIPDLLIYYNYV